MAQVTDRTVGENPTGFDMRTELNNIISALESDNSGSSEPLNTVAGMKWMDTSNATYYYYKERNHDNTAWVTLFRYTVATKIMEAVSNGVVLNDVVVHKTGDETKAGILTLTDGLKLQNQNVSPFSGFKNYIINGNFDVWQYGTSQTSPGYGSDDRWLNGNVGSSKAHSLQLCSDTERALFNASHFSRTVVTSVSGASNFVFKQHRIENIHKLAGKTVTLSFWAKADSNKKLGISSEVHYGTGGSPSSELDKAGIQQILDLTAVWKKFTITVALPTAVGKTLGTDGVHTSHNQITFWFDAGSALASTFITGMIQQSGTFDIAQVQLEEGSVATPFEQRPYGLELSLCQRYYEVCKSHILGNAYTSPAYLSTQIKFAVAKRVIPSINYSHISQANVATYSTTSTTIEGCVDYITASSASGLVEHIGTIAVSAEL